MDTGLIKIFVEAKVLLQGTANKVMAEKGFYQAVNAHIELYESFCSDFGGRRLKTGFCGT